ncbi:MAG: ATP-binding protein [Thermodesulfobacteriota bacterium]
MTQAADKTFSSKQADFPYFRRIWQNVVVALLATSFIPLIVIGGGMYHYAATVLREKTLEALRAEVTNHKITIDRFLAERIMDLKLLSKNLGPEHLVRPGALESVFQSLQKELPCFQDLGVIDDQGRHLAYVGPYELMSKNYKDTFWFKALAHESVYISDVFLGFRNIPHFVMAVKQQRGDGFWILRATVDTDYFNNVVAGINQTPEGDAFLVNKDGIFQTTPRRAGRLMGPSDFTKLEPYQGIRQVEQNGLIKVMVWLEKVPWLCVVQVEQKKIFGDLYKVRNIGIFVLILGSMLIVLTVLLTTNYLIGRLETKRRSIRTLDLQLQHTSRQASSVPMLTGFLLKIKDAFAGIDMAAQNASSKITEDFRPGETVREISDGLARIQSRASQNRKSIDRFLNAVRPLDPMIMEININEMLDNLIELYDRDLHFNRIRLVRHYHTPAPLLRSDPSRLRQVFQNLIFNAMTAIHQDGTIVLKTDAADDSVHITVTDDGPGIPAENLDKIFDPHFTTKAEGMGLGLSICRKILNKLGGRISIRNEPEKGVAVTVELPSQFKPVVEQI